MPIKILIAEDDAIARRVLTLFLNPYGSVEAAATGEDAVAKFEFAHTSGAPYDLVCLDISMPGLHGLDALRKMRIVESSGNSALTPVLMLTGTSEEAAITEANALGVRGFILKPIIEADLIDHLTALGFSAQSV